MKKHKDSLSQTSLKRIISNKYNKVQRTVSFKDISKEYEQREDGWRRKGV